MCARERSEKEEEREGGEEEEETSVLSPIDGLRLRDAASVCSFLFFFLSRRGSTSALFRFLSSSSSSRRSLNATQSTWVFLLPPPPSSSSCSSSWCTPLLLSLSLVTLESFCFFFLELLLFLSALSVYRLCVFCRTGGSS